MNLLGGGGGDIFREKQSKLKERLMRGGSSKKGLADGKW